MWLCFAIFFQDRDAIHSALLLPLCLLVSLPFPPEFPVPGNPAQLWAAPCRCPASYMPPLRLGSPSSVCWSWIAFSVHIDLFVLRHLHHQKKLLALSEPLERGSSRFELVFTVLVVYRELRCVMQASALDDVRFTRVGCFSVGARDLAVNDGKAGCPPDLRVTY